VTGHICLELFKVLLDKPVDKFMNTFSNLALPLFVCQEPDRPASVKSVIKGKEFFWTAWDRIDIDRPDMTLQGLVDHLLETYGVELTMLSAGVSILYSDFMDRKKAAERKGMTLKQVVEAVTKKEIPSTQRFMTLELICSDEESGDEVEMPCLRFRLPPM
jgi:ubiquitin-activating enzyme E1